MSKNDEEQLMKGVLTQLETGVDNFDRMTFKKVLKLILAGESEMDKDDQFKLLVASCVLLMDETAQLRLKLGELEDPEKWRKVWDGVQDIQRQPTG